MCRSAAGFVKQYTADSHLYIASPSCRSPFSAYLLCDKNRKKYLLYSQFPRNKPACTQTRRAHSSLNGLIFDRPFDLPLIGFWHSAKKNSWETKYCPSSQSGNELRLTDALVPIIFKVTSPPRFQRRISSSSSSSHAKPLRGRGGRCYARQLRRQATPKACQKDSDDGDEGERFFSVVAAPGMSRYLWLKPLGLLEGGGGRYRLGRLGSRHNGLSFTALRCGGDSLPH